MPFGDGLRAIIRLHHTSGDQRMLEALEVLQGRINDIRTYQERGEQEAAHYENIARECREKAKKFASEIESLEAAIVKLGGNVGIATPSTDDTES